MIAVSILLAAIVICPSSFVIWGYPNFKSREQKIKIEIGQKQAFILNSFQFIYGSQSYFI